MSDCTCVAPLLLLLLAAAVVVLVVLVVVVVLFGLGCKDHSGPEFEPELSCRWSPDGATMVFFVSVEALILGMPGVAGVAGVAGVGIP